MYVCMYVRAHIRPHPTPHHTHTPHPTSTPTQLACLTFSAGSRQVSRKGASCETRGRYCETPVFSSCPCLAILSVLSVLSVRDGVASQLDFARASCQVVDSLQAIATCIRLQRAGSPRNRRIHAGWIREKCPHCLCLRCVEGKPAVVDQDGASFFDLG